MLYYLEKCVCFRSDSMSFGSALLLTAKLALSSAIFLAPRCFLPLCFFLCFPAGTAMTVPGGFVTADARRPLDRNKETLFISAPVPPIPVNMAAIYCEYRQCAVGSLSVHTPFSETRVVLRTVKLSTLYDKDTTIYLRNWNKAIVCASVTGRYFTHYLIKNKLTVYIY